MSGLVKLWRERAMWHDCQADNTKDLRLAGKERARAEMCRQHADELEALL